MQPEGIGVRESTCRHTSRWYIANGEDWKNGEESTAIVLCTWWHSSRHISRPRDKKVLAGYPDVRTRRSQNVEGERCPSAMISREFNWFFASSSRPRRRDTESRGQARSGREAGEKRAKVSRRGHRGLSFWPIRRYHRDGPRVTW